MADAPVQISTRTLLTRTGLNAGTQLFGVFDGGIWKAIDAATLRAALNTEIARDSVANIEADYDPVTWDGCFAYADDLGMHGGQMIAHSGAWAPWFQSTIIQFGAQTPTAVFGGGSATYSQSGTTVTVTKTAHGIPADFDGMTIHLTGGTGTFVTEYCTNFTRTGADTFTCTSATSRITSGNLGTNTAETFLATSYTAPDWTRDGIAGGITYFCRGTSSANNKTFRCYYSGIQCISSSVQTTATAGLVSTSSSVRWVSPTTFFPGNPVGVGVTGNGVINTETTRLFTASIQLANSGEWALMWPQFMFMNWRV